MEDITTDSTTIEDSLDVPEVPAVQAVGPVPAVVNIEDAELETDFKTARDNINRILETGNTALEGLASIAERSQNPYSYEVLTQLIKTVSETNKDLLDLHKKRKSIKESEVSRKPEGPGEVKNYFVGSTKDLQEMLSNQIIPVKAVNEE